MKMLSVANVASLLGGTGRCAVDCVRALPDWEHQVIFRGGSRLGECREALNCPTFRGQFLVEQVAKKFQPDVILYHNTQANQVPRHLPGLSVFYQHSANHEGNKRPFRARLIVSNALADRLELPREEVLYQPVAKPPFPANFQRDKRITIGRLCTPTRSKWDHQLLPWYRSLIRRFPDYRWEFVGAPDWFQRPLETEFGDQVGFLPAGVNAASRMHSWDALLYRGVWESYGRTICEAQQCGCIPIAEKTGGVVEQIKDGVDGFLFAADAELHAALEALTDCDWKLKMKISGLHAGRERGSLSGWRRRFLERIGLEVSA